MEMLKRIRIAGWKSIKDQTIDLTPLNVVIGANGAGKSNLLSLFKLLDELSSTRLRAYVGQNGYADSLLHYGSRQTPVAELELTFSVSAGELTYFARLGVAARGALIFLGEHIEVLETGSLEPRRVDLGAGHPETNLIQAIEGGNSIAKTAWRLLLSCRLFHFHDTSDTSGARMPCYIEGNHSLSPDADNLASMLYLYRERHPQAFRRITATARQIIPDFEGFVLEPRQLNEHQVLLNWTHKGRDYEFGPHQLSDGSLRFIALATLLLQPEEKLPTLIALDEPELGLHPAALEVLAGMAKATSSRAQLLFGTQSPALLDHFEPENVIVVNSRTGASEFQRLDAESLKEWLVDYTLGEIWEKNVVGGGPYA